MMELLVDMQGFQGACNEFIVKELAYISLDAQDIRPTVMFFQPPSSHDNIPVKYRSANLWLERNYHGLSWSYGRVPYHQLDAILKKDMKNVRKIYVKGCEKKEWLKGLFHYSSPAIINIEDHFDDSPSISKFEDSSCDSCPFHCNMVKITCAVKNVLLLKKWMSTKISRSVDKSIRLYFELKNLALMDSQDIAYLPHSFLSTFAKDDVHEAWSKLTDAMRADHEIARCKRCFEHYQSMGEDDFDGPLPMIMDCRKCSV